MINLEKDVERVKITLDKRKQIVDCEVAAVMDCSGSAKPFYYNEFYQTVVERCLPIAMVVDIDKKIDSWIFDTNFKQMVTITVNNIEGYINKQVVKHCTWGGTYYGRVLEDIKNKFAPSVTKFLFLKRTKPVSPVLVLFFTDGANDDKEQFDKFLKTNIDNNLFIQIIGIGVSDYVKEYILKLTAKYHHLGFIALDTIDSIDDEDLYDGIISEKFVTWYNKFKGQ